MFCGPSMTRSSKLRIPTIATTDSDGSRPPVPIDRDQGGVVLTAPLDDGGDVSLLFVGQARREAVPVVNRRDPRESVAPATFIEETDNHDLPTPQGPVT